MAGYTDSFVCNKVKTGPMMLFAKFKGNLISTERINLFLIVLLAVLVASCTRKPSIQFFKGNYVQAFEIAAKEHKKVLVLISDSSCGSCNKFIEHLNDQDRTVDILRREYICLKEDMQKKDDRLLMRMFKCPSFPFPYFFDQDANLITMGFPNSKAYDISDLRKISIDEYRFTELFQLPVTSGEYKKLISLNMKASLLMQKNNIDSAYHLFKTSLQICSYPYNLRSVSLLSKILNEPSEGIDSLIKNYKPSESDNFIYNGFTQYLELNEGTDKLIAQNPGTGYSFSENNERVLGEIKVGQKTRFAFTITNTSSTPLIIFKVSHPCDCIRLSWSSEPLKPNEKSLISGEFTPYQKGDFRKEIFIHTNSNNNPMGVFKISGSASEQ